MGEHYARAELDATVAEDGTIEVEEPRNVTGSRSVPPVLASGAKRPRRRRRGRRCRRRRGIAGAARS